MSLTKDHVTVPRVLTANEAAEYLRVNRKRVYELTRTAGLPYHRYGERQLVFIATELADWLADNLVVAA